MKSRKPKSFIYIQLVYNLLPFSKLFITTSLFSPTFPLSLSLSVVGFSIIHFSIFLTLIFSFDSSSLLKKYHFFLSHKFFVQKSMKTCSYCSNKKLSGNEIFKRFILSSSLFFPPSLLLDRKSNSVVALT